MSDSPAASAFPPVSYEIWRSRVAAELGADAEARLRSETVEGLVVEPLHSADHVDGDVPLPRLAPPSGAWRIWQELPASAGVAGRAALARERDRGLGGVWLRLDGEGATAAELAALLGDCLAGGGVELALELAGEPLVGATLAVSAAQAAGAAVAEIGGCLGCDPLGSLARRGSLSGGACDQLVGTARWAIGNAPKLRAGLVSTAPYADAGADAVQEIAFALATGAEMLRKLLAAGIEPAAAASQLLCSLHVGRGLYLQVAKLRAMRLTWGMLLASVDAPPNAFRLHGRTAWRTKGKRDPGSDLVRATVETFAAVLGGCDDVTCAPILDEETELALGIPLGSATQLLLREEVGLDRVADAAGGSWYVESLTAQLARRAWEIFEGIERRGGMLRALAVGAIAQQVAEAAEGRRAALLEKRLPIVGVTVHAAKEPAPLPHRPLTAAIAASPSRNGASSTPKFLGLHGEPDSAELFSAGVAAAALGASAAALAGAVPSRGAPLRAPALTSWRDAEPFEAAEATA
jgi:methylmalonyl-CoA mutase